MAARFFESFALGGGYGRFVGFDAATGDFVIVILGDMNDGDLIIGVNQNCACGGASLHKIFVLLRVIIVIIPWSSERRKHEHA